MTKNTEILQKHSYIDFFASKNNFSIAILNFFVSNTFFSAAAFSLYLFLYHAQMNIIHVVKQDSFINQADTKFISNKKKISHLDERRCRIVRFLFNLWMSRCYESKLLTHTLIRKISSFFTKAKKVTTTATAVYSWNWIVFNIIKQLHLERTFTYLDHA